MNPFRSVGARLSLALLVVVAGALGLVYLIVVPQLEDRLVNSKIVQLERWARRAAPAVPQNQFAWLDFAEKYSPLANARVVLYTYSSPPLALRVVADSGSARSVDVQNDRLALRAAESLRRQRGTETRGGERFAEVAVPVADDGVLLFSAPLHDSLANVHLVQRRLLIAGLFALLLSLAVGYGGAWLFTRRIRRLERAAERIAGGRFDEPVGDAGSDELGQLAAAFERMRLRLAHLDRARREFIANASHELRTPLFSLGGFLELLADEELDEETRREFLATMREQVDRLTRLATDLLDLSRLDAGRMHLERQRVDLGQLARDLAEEFTAVARGTGHPLEAHADGDLAGIGDEQRVLQIGRALLENAILHTESGTAIRVWVESANGLVRLAVEDEGPGIPAEQATHLFERFYRLAGTRTSGSGLGLSIARELAELMGGTLEVESKPGRTVFTLTLRAAPAEAPAAFSRENVTEAVPPLQ